MAAPQSSIETHPQRSKIIDQLLQNIPLRDIASWTNPRVSPAAISRYNLAVVKPAAGKASIQPIPNGQGGDSRAIQQTIQQSPVRARLESLHQRTERFLDEADVTNGAPYLNAATKQIDLLARLTGELHQADGPSVNIQIVIPGSGVELSAAAGRIDLSEAEGNCFEMGDNLK